MNSICIIGNICNELELKQTQSVKNVCSFNIAVKRPFNKDVTDFFTVVAWNKQAENICKYCGKGSRIGVTGTMTTRKWEDKDGISRTAYEILANEIEFLMTKNDGQNNVSDVVEDNPFEVLQDGFMPVVDEDSLPF